MRNLLFPFLPVETGISEIGIILGLSVWYIFMIRPDHILANFQISERGTNERKKFKKRNIPKFPIHYYTKIAAKTGTHDKIILFFASKRGTVGKYEIRGIKICHFFLKSHHF